MRRAMRTAIWVLPVLAGSILSPTRPNIKPTAPKIKPSFADVPLKKSTTIPLRIDGEWYDAGGWADEHPGGRWLLEYARGRDVTALFHSIHLRARGSTERALQQLPKLDADAIAHPSASGLPPTQLEAESAEQGAFVLDLYDDAPEEAPLPPIDSPLRRELAQFLRRNFPTSESTKATPTHWARTALALAGTLACWAGWFSGNALACLLLPFVHWVLIAHTVHEATHGNLSTDPRVNYWLQFTCAHARRQPPLSSKPSSRLQSSSF